MKEAQALKMVREMRSLLKNLGTLDAELINVASLTERAEYLGGVVHELEVQERDMTAAVQILETKLVSRRQEVGSEIGGLEAKLATERNRLEGDMATAQREHNARINAMKNNEAKMADELAAKEGK